MKTTGPKSISAQRSRTAGASVPSSNHRPYSKKTLYTVDELSGFVSACALVRPSKSVADLEVKSVKKKWKQMSFAAGVDRDVVAKGMAMLDVEFDDITADVINALREVSDDIGL